MTEEFEVLFGRHFDQGEPITNLGNVLGVKLNGIDIYMVRSGIGKVNAAVATARLIDHYECSAIVITGISGSLVTSLKIGDIVVATGAFQHDFDLRPITSQAGLLPGNQRIVIESDTTLTQLALRAADNVLRDLITPDFDPSINLGVVASGDQIISSDSAKAAITQIVSDSLCVDMETGAVAQVCYEAKIPWTALRIISDFAYGEFDLESVIRFARGEAAFLIAELIGTFADHYNDFS